MSELRLVARRKAFDGAFDALRELGENLAQRLGDTGLLGFEMRIEAAMGEAGLLHQLGDGEAVRTLLPQHAGRDLHQLFVGFLLMAPVVAHDWLPCCLRQLI